MKAIVFVDVQNDFVKGGALAYAEPMEDLVPYIRDCAVFAREAGIVAYATKDLHCKAGDILNYEETLEGKSIPPHCIEGTSGCEIVPGLSRDEGVDAVYIPHGRIIPKSSFGSLRLPHRIWEDFRRMDEPVDEIYICGFCTSICVISNALILRAEFPDAKISIVRNLCGDLSAEAHDAALLVAKNNLIGTVLWGGEGFVKET